MYFVKGSHRCSNDARLILIFSSNDTSFCVNCLFFSLPYFSSTSFLLSFLFSFFFLLLCIPVSFLSLSYFVLASFGLLFPYSQQVFRLSFALSFLSIPSCNFFPFFPFLPFRLLVSVLIFIFHFVCLLLSFFLTFSSYLNIFISIFCNYDSRLPFPPVFIISFSLFFLYQIVSLFFFLPLHPL